MAKKTDEPNPTVAPMQMKPPRVPSSKRATTRADTYFSVYTNDLQLQTSPWDVRLIIGEILDPDTENNILNVKQLGEIRMSPQIAKSLTMFLAEQLKNYEASFGPIPGPPPQS